MKNKLKTKSAAKKRIKVTGKKKFIERSCTQGHFNARDRGKDTTAKRTEKNVSKTFKKHLKGLLPYQQ